MRKKGVRGVDRAGKVNAAKSIFQGTYYAFDIHINRKTIKRIKVIYEEGQHNRILFQMVEVFQTNGYRLVGVDIEEVLRHISGFTSDQPIILQGPKVLPREESPPGYDYAANWMLGERKLIDDLVKLVFSRVDLVALNSRSIDLFPHLIGATGTKTYMKAEILYSLSPATSAKNTGNDLLYVYIDGDDKVRKTFHFDHTKQWMINRYLVAPLRIPAVTTSDNGVSASAAAPSSDDVD